MPVLPALYEKDGLTAVAATIFEVRQLEWDGWNLSTGSLPPVPLTVEARLDLVESLLGVGNSSLAVLAVDSDGVPVVAVDEIVTGIVVLDLDPDGVPVAVTA